MLYYPKSCTEAEWKKLAKQLKISDTGVSQTLRNLAKAHATVDDGMFALEQGKARDEKVAAAAKVATGAASKAKEAIRDAEGAIANTNEAGSKKLRELATVINQYQRNLESFRPRTGWEKDVKNFNARVKDVESRMGK